MEVFLVSYNTVIEFDSSEVPVVFEIDLGGTIFLMGINHNFEFNFLTVDLYDVEGLPVVLGEKLVLDKPLFEDLIDERLPGPTIIPSDLAKNEESITIDNIGKTVFLYLDDGGDDE